AGHDIVPVWVVLLMFAATEGYPIHLRVRRGGHAISLMEIPMVLGLLGTAPLPLTLARLVGGAVGLALFRRQRGTKLAFNLALLGMQATVGFAVFAAVA